MDWLYGGVCYAGIDVDPDLKYLKGAGRVAFSNQQSYIAAISARFVQLQHGDINKRVSAGKRLGGRLRKEENQTTKMLRGYREVVMVQKVANGHSSLAQLFRLALY